MVFEFVLGGCASFFCSVYCGIAFDLLFGFCCGVVVLGLDYSVVDFCVVWCFTVDLFICGDGSSHFPLVFLCGFFAIYLV